MCICTFKFHVCTRFVPTIYTIYMPCIYIYSCLFWLLQFRFICTCMNILFSGLVMFSVSKSDHGYKKTIKNIVFDFMDCWGVL